MSPRATIRVERGSCTRSDMTMPARPPASARAPGSDPEPTTALIREALGQVREVVRLEVALARQELTTELAVAKTSAIALGAGAVATLVGLTMLLVAIALALPVPWIGAVVLGALLLVLAAGLGVVGWRRWPKKPLEKTKKRVETDIAEAKERLT
jgi:Putative Actinobacterial Holin-X, holin superfamily III